MAAIQAAYMLFDVFTDERFAGNQLAIFPESSFDDATMQRIARELNLSETVFLAPGNDDVLACYRIFTPLRELAFAGHPTVGTSIALVDHLWWAGPNETGFVLRAPIGDVPIAIERGTPTIAWFEMPPVKWGGEVERSAAATILSLPQTDVRDDLPPALAGSGNPLLFVALRSKEAVDRAALDPAAVRRHLDWNGINGVYLFCETEQGAYARMFAPMSGIAEDPATGGATGPMYAYLARYAKLARRERFVNEQGVALGRRSLLHVRIAWNGEDVERIEIGGSAVFVGEGKLQVG